MMNLSQILNLAEGTDELIIGKGVISKCSSVIQKYWPEKSVLIAADSNTWEAAGEIINTILKAKGINTHSLIFDVPPFLHADYENVNLIKHRAAELNNPLLVAVGSGTINDLVKRAAFELESTYLCIGTAASMDGYCSSGAALLKNGRKQTMECGAPKVIIADTDILKTAPAEASSAGYGDLASKLTAGADWIIADFTGDDPIEKRVWNIVQPNLERWLSSPESLSAGRTETLSGIFEGLNFSGLAMQVLGRSRAASGAEHLLSHIWEMSGHRYADGTPVSHGFQVSIGIICITALFEEVFSINSTDIDIDAAVAAYPSWDERAQEIENLMSGLPSWQEYLEICRQKHLSTENLRTKLLKVKTDWNKLRTAVWTTLPHFRVIRKMLKAAGCPVKPEEINLSINDAMAAFKKAQCMRNRYTILDLAYELGIFSNCIENVRNNELYLLK